jgi:hypothetical protein
MKMKSESPFQVCLSAKGLAKLPQNVYENDFTFIVGDDRYKCPSFVAAFLSPRVCSLQRTDGTLHEFIIETKDPNQLFESIVGLGEGRSMTVSATNSSFVRSICYEL